MADPPTSTSSNSSCTSFSSCDDISVKSNDTSVKFVCNYGGKILPSNNHGQLSYFGGDHGILSVDCSMSYSELMEKLCELSGYKKATLRCKLPDKDLDALITIKSDEGLLNLMEEYDFVNRGKIHTLETKAFLYEVKSSPSFDDIGGMNWLLEALEVKVLAPLCCPKLLEIPELGPMDGILLHGQPGCRKTMLAHAIANETYVPFYEISAYGLLSEVSGDSEKKSKRPFRTGPLDCSIDYFH